MIILSASISPLVISAENKSLFSLILFTIAFNLSFVDGSTYQKEFLELDYYGGAKYKNDNLNAIVIGALSI